jgi:hypothetical protein
LAGVPGCFFFLGFPLFGDVVIDCVHVCPFDKVFPIFCPTPAQLADIGDVLAGVLRDCLVAFPVVNQPGYDSLCLGHGGSRKQLYLDLADLEAQNIEVMINLVTTGDTVYRFSGKFSPLLHFIH